MVHNMRLDDVFFEAVKSKNKTIEMRLYDEKRRKIVIGDIIEFENRETKEKLQAQVINLHIVSSFEELYNMFDKKSLGYKDYEIALYTDMEQYYLKTEIEKYGVVGIEIRLM